MLVLGLISYLNEKTTSILLFIFLVFTTGSTSLYIKCIFLKSKDDVAVVDEIQMIKDAQRGWAWTRAVLGLFAKEIHVCGEASAIDLVKEFALTTGEEVEVSSYFKKIL